MSDAPSLLYPHRSGEGSALYADDNAGFDGGRVYEWKGYLLDSVTSIISAGVPKGEVLTKWAAKAAAEYAVANRVELLELPPEEAEQRIKSEPFKRRDDAAELGNNVHDYAEAFVLGIPLPTMSEAAHVKAALFRKWIDDYRPEFEAAECWVYSLGRRYAGRFDAIANVPGIGRTLIDYKSGKRAYPEVGLQCAALRNAEFVGLADGTEVDMPAVDACAVLHLAIRGYKFNLVRADEAAFNTFLYAQQISAWRKDSHSVINHTVVPLPPSIPPRPNAPANIEAMLG